MIKALTAAFAFVAFTGSCVSVIAQAGNDVVPTPEYLSAAMNDQISGAGSSVDVRYTYTFPESSGFSPIELHYMRSKNLLRIETCEKDGGASIYESFDRQNHEWRQLTLRSVGKSTGRITGEVSGALDTQLPFDPIYRPLDEGRLCDAIRRGSVSPIKEEVDGHSCWRVVIPAFNSELSTVDEHTIWVDPTISYCPRKIEIGYKKSYSTLHVVIKFVEYAEVSTGIWYPSEIHYIGNPIENTPTEYISKLQSITMNNVPSSAQSVVSFPPGTEIYDELSAGQYLAE